MCWGLSLLLLHATPRGEIRGLDLIVIFMFVQDKSIRILLILIMCQCEYGMDIFRKLYHSSVHSCLTRQQ